MKTRSVVTWAVVFAVIMSLMLLYVWKGWRAGVLASRVDALKAEQQRLLDEHDRLRAEAVTLSHVDRVKEIATERLGLVDPPLTPVDVPAIAPLGPPDSLTATKATGTELWSGKEGRASVATTR